jgi:8-oxo-dGTP pyrophosphatase MutT (NUDIX family)
MRIRSPNTGDAFWVLPGGGLEPGESDEAGMRRELAEELGLTAFAMGPLLGLRQHTFNWREARYRQRERIYAVHAPRFEPRMRDAVEQQVFVAFAWTGIAALAAFPEPLTPRADAGDSGGLTYACLRARPKLAPRHQRKPRVALWSRCRSMLSTSAYPAISVSIAVPPKEMSGRGMPTTGMRPMTIEVLMIT